jgi:hypothetical protein
MRSNSPFLLRLVLATICLSVVSAAQALKPVQLPPPQTTGGRPLMEVLKDRKSTREFGSQVRSRSRRFRTCSGRLSESTDPMGVVLRLPP